MLTFGSLFAGIGGFDLGFERCGFKCKWQVEIDDYATKVLEKHWPEVHRERDIRECGIHNLEPVDLICGGFPCQDISYAGRGAGLGGKRSGLFFEAIRVVRQLKPRFIVLENVAALLTRGLDRVLGTLAEIGYDCEWHCIPASYVGAPHRRDRIWIIANSEAMQRKEIIGMQSNRNSESVETLANSNSNSNQTMRRKCSSVKGKSLVRGDDGGGGQRDAQWEESSGSTRQDSSLANTDSEHGKRIFEGIIDTKERQIEGEGSIGSCGSGYGWDWSTEPEICRVAHGVPHRVDRFRCLGNAVVPQVVELIGRMMIEKFNLS